MLHVLFVCAPNSVWIVPRRRHRLISVIGIHTNARGDLSQIIYARRLSSLFPGPAQRRQYQRRQNSDNREDNEHLNQGKAVVGAEDYLPPLRLLFESDASISVDDDFGGIGGHIILLNQYDVAKVGSLHQARQLSRRTNLPMRVVNHSAVRGQILLQLH